MSSRPSRRPPPRLADTPYRSHRRPAFGRDDRQITTRLVTLHPEDGHEWDGLLLRPRFGDPALRKLLVIVVHGSVGNPQSQGAVERCNRSIKSMPFSCCFYRGFGPLLWANLSTLCVAC